MNTTTLQHANIHPGDLDYECIHDVDLRFSACPICRDGIRVTAPVNDARPATFGNARRIVADIANLVGYTDHTDDFLSRPLTDAIIAAFDLPVDRHAAKPVIAEQVAILADLDYDPQVHDCRGGTSPTNSTLTVAGLLVLRDAVIALHNGKEG